ncbi:MAG: 3'-5' exonuclease [Lachnospiraceae bacterium]|jgi:DNA polymerase-3 subunit epsilon|nr:3'-5' exonuclease [Lachnospiraceae bacterium]
MEDYCVIDLEMTGLNAKYHKILEVAGMRVRSKKIVGTFSELIYQELPLDEEIIKLTGITDEMVKSADSEQKVLDAFFTFLGEDILVGQNVIFDYGFLKQAAVNRKIPFERQAVDTLKIARRCLLDLEKRDLESLCAYYQISMGQHHRAMDDVQATQILYEKMEAEFLEKQPDIFRPRPLIYRAKRQTPATQRQKKHLKELAEYHKIELDLAWDTLTRNEASRQANKIISKYGKMSKN